MFIASVSKYSWFFSFILWPAKLVTSSGTFLLVFLGFYTYEILSFENKDSCTSHFPIWMAMIYLFFSLLHQLELPVKRWIEVAVVKSLYCFPFFFHAVHYISALFLREESTSIPLSPLSMRLARDFSYMPFLRLIRLPSSLKLLKVYIINECWNLSNAFFCIYWVYHMVFVLYIINKHAVLH